MNDLLLDPSWWMLAVALIAGVALWWQGNQRQDKTLKRVGLGVLLLGVVWASVSWFIDTPKEGAERRTRQIVNAVEGRDWQRLRSLLDERTAFRPIYNNRDDLVEGARATADQIGLRNVRILGMNVQQKDTVILVDFRALSEQDRTGGQNTVTDWQFDYQNRGGGWKLYEIRPLRSEQVNPDQIIANLARLRS